MFSRVLVMCALTYMAPARAHDETLATKYNCLACHAPDRKIVGPAYKDVAAKYKDDPKALETLMSKVKNGGSGVWGAVPMPPNNVPDADLKTLVEWVLSTK
jgi:cytochrome c